MLSELWTINIIWSINIVWTINIVSINLSEFYPQGACAWWTQPMLFTLSCSGWTSMHDKETGFPSYSQTGTRIRYNSPIRCFFHSRAFSGFSQNKQNQQIFHQFSKGTKFSGTHHSRSNLRPLRSFLISGFPYKPWRNTAMSSCPCSQHWEVQVEVCLHLNPISRSADQRKESSRCSSFPATNWGVRMQNFFREHQSWAFRAN